MLSLLQDIWKPEITAFLDAVDEVMNSNTMLLKVQADELLNTDNCADVLNTFLKDPLFPAMMLDLDLKRDWYHYHLWMKEDDGNLEPKPSIKKMARENVELKLTAMDVSGFVERLHWMLRTAWSPYNKHLSEPQAREIITGLFEGVFAKETWLFPPSPQHSYWNDHPWSFYDVRPDFLYSHDERNEEFLSTYFDGWACDSCSFFFLRDVFYLLLTNGCA